MKIVDLHIHTTGSDGSFTPTELVKYAVEKGLSAVAITDHDTMRGIKEALDYIKNMGISLELIPGMEISSQNNNYPYGLHILAYFIDKSAAEIDKIIKVVEKELKNDLSPLGVIRTIKKYGGLSSLAHPLEYGYSIKQLDKVAKELSEYGLNGIEGYYTTHSKSYIKEIKNIVTKYNMVVTGGTDFHGTRKHGVDLGSGFGDLKIPYKVLKDLREIKN